MFCLKVISTCYFTLIFKFHMTSAFHFIYSTNCKFKVRKLVKAINGSRSMDYQDNNGHPISKSNTMFSLKGISTCNFTLIFKFHMSSAFHLFIVQTANSKYESWWKLLMEVRQWTNIVIMVIQFPRVTLCIAWSYFNLQFNLITYFICPQLFILFIVNCKFKVRKLVQAINGSVSMD